jgi:hypothetical protein
MSNLNNTIKNFGKIKNVYNNILIENISSNNVDNKSIFKNYIKTIKKDNILKEQFLIYNNIENKIETDRNKAVEYVKESIALLKKYPKNDILESNVKLLADVVFEVDNDYDKKELHESISYLIFTDKNVNTLDSILEATDKIVDYILNNKPKEITESLDIPNSLLLSLSVDKYNEEYDTLSENEKKLINVIIESNENEKEELFKSINSECLTLVNDKIVESEGQTKEKLLNVKERLLNQKFNNSLIRNR